MVSVIAPRNQSRNQSLTAPYAILTSYFAAWVAFNGAATVNTILLAKEWADLSIGSGDSPDGVPGVALATLDMRSIFTQPSIPPHPSGEH